mmetsp:Transcript_55643/g.162679  ORF Transcript_55643/g.162679 Transcript_55643/m.162679 type:complete len:270 (-) Transcript_55643:380-1189(-)
MQPLKVVSLGSSNAQVLLPHGIDQRGLAVLDNGLPEDVRGQGVDRLDPEVAGGVQEPPLPPLDHDPLVLHAAARDVQLHVRDLEAQAGGVAGGGEHPAGDDRGDIQGGHEGEPPVHGDGPHRAGRRLARGRPRAGHVGQASFSMHSVEAVSNPGRHVAHGPDRQGVGVGQVGQVEGAFKTAVAPAAPWRRHATHSLLESRVVGVFLDAWQGSLKRLIDIWKLAFQQSQHQVVQRRTQACLYLDSPPLNILKYFDGQRTRTCSFKLRIFQ